MDAQTIINISVGLVGTLIGAILRAIWWSLKDLQVADAQIVTKIHDIENLVGSQYMTRMEFQSSMGALFTKLDRIEDKLDGKQDKP